MINFIEELSYNMIDILIIYIMCSALIDKKMTETGIRILYTIPVLLLNTLTDVLVRYDIVSYILGYCFMAIAVYIIFKESVIQTIYLYIISFILCSIIQLLLILFMKPAAEIFTANENTYLGSFLTVIIELIIYRFAPVKVIYHFITRKSLIVKSIVLNIFVFFLVIILLSKFSPEMFFQYLTIFFISVIVLVLSFLEILHSQKEIIEKNKQLDAYSQYMPIVNELITHVRMKQHDFDNQIQAIKMLPASCPDYDSLSQKLSSYSDYLIESASCASLLKINMKLIAGFLFSKACQAEESRIDFQIHILNYNLTTKLQEYDLIEVLGILIDNAFEATGQHGRIHLYMDCKDTGIIVKITNPGELLTPEMRKNFFTKGYSTKPKIADHKIRGLDLFKMKKLLDENQGKIYLYNDFDEDHNSLICFEVVV